MPARQGDRKGTPLQIEKIPCTTTKALCRCRYPKTIVTQRFYSALPIVINLSADMAASWRGISRIDWASAAFL